MKARWIAVLAMSAALEAQTTPAGVRLEDLQVVELKPRVGILGETKIGLPEVIERVLASDKDLEISRILRDESRYNVSAAKGFYDPVMGFSAYHTRAVTPVASVLGGAANGKLTQTEWNGTPQLSGITPFGGNYNLSLSNARQTNNSQFTTLNPQYPTSLGLGLTQPLWRGLLFDENRERLQVARKNQRLSDEQLRQRVIEVVTGAVQAYWELDYAWQNYRVQTEAVRLAEQQYASNRRQAEQGVLAPVDVVAAQTQVATFQQSLFAAQQALTQAENSLKQMMLPNRNDLLWSAALVPETASANDVKLPELREAVERALAMRPELKQSAIGIEINRLATRLANEQAKPRVDAFASLSLTGLAGIPVAAGQDPLSEGFSGLVTRLNDLSVAAGLPPISGISFGGGVLPPGLVGSYGQSLAGIYHGNFPTAQVGVQVSLPLRNRTALAQAQTSMAEGRRLKAFQEQVAMLIEADVRNSIQAVSSAQSRRDAASLARRSAEEQYASEQRQFQAGTSTVFLVLQRQTDLIAARSREVRARADLAEAVANLERATAATIESHNIKLDGSR